MNNITAPRHFQNHVVPMDMMRSILLGTVTLMNLSLPFLEISDTVITTIGSGLNVAVGVVGLVVLYLLRNNVRYHISFTNMNKPVKREPPAEEIGEDDLFEKEDGKTSSK